MWFNDPTNQNRPPVIPQIAQAYQNDPRTKLAMQTLQNGTSTEATPGYGYGVPTGLARMISAIGGALMAKNAAKNYKGEEQQYMTDFNAARKIATAMGGGQQPQAGNTATPPPQAFAPQPQGQDPRQAVQQFAGAQPPFNPMMSGQQGIAPGDQQSQLLQQVMGQQLPFGRTPATNAARGADSRGYTSYKSPIYDEAEAKASAATGVPQELIRAIRTYGERSNANQVSSAGARGVYQFIPATRKLFKERYGVDAWAGPEQGAMAAALHLKQSLEANKGDRAAAIGEYIGGPNRENWGKVTRAYVARVQRGMGGPMGTEGGANQGPVMQPDAVVRNPEDFVTASLPPEYQEPGKPTAEGPTQSYRMRMANAMLDTSNPYMFADGQKMLDQGMGEQMSADEAAAVRRQNLTDAQYSARLNRWGQSASARENDAYNARQNQRGFGSNLGIQHDSQNYRTIEREDSQAHDVAQTEQNFRNTWNLNSQQQEFQRSMAKTQFEYRTALQRQQIEGKQLTEAEKRAGRQVEFFNTPQGRNFYAQATQQAGDADAVLAQIDQFEQMNASQGTGGILLNTPIAGAIRRWMDGDLQAMDAITQDMSIKLSSALKGAISDKEGARIIAAIPSIYNKQGANTATIARIRAALQRGQERRQAELEALAAGGVQGGIKFNDQWNKYINSTPVESNITFAQWQAGARNGTAAPAKAGGNGGFKVLEVK